MADFNLNLDFLQRLTTPKKILLLAAIVAAIGGLYYYFLFQPHYKKYTRLQKQYKKAQLTLNQTRQIASQLEKFEQEMQALQGEFKIAARKLPNSKEIPLLLMQITKLGKEAGLQFLLFKPLGEKPVNFYAQIPIDIEVVGGYHAVSSFFNQMCTMPRIVSLGNFSMGNYQVVDGKDLISTKFQAITYTFKNNAKKGEQHGS
ncbi:MAG: type 4a pilus biogenesis protein PilO [Deltaproteobacteria bacterium]|nr:type 4a pilus biogenesis protein PilO [Deltaproteobacteria bacterium]